MERIYLILMFLAFFISWIADELTLLPHFFTWSIELFILILFINFLLPKIIFFKKISLTPFGTSLLFIMTYGLIGSFIYFVDFYSTALGVRTFFKYAVLFLIFINSNFTKKFYKKMFNYWLLLMAIQPIIVIIQYLSALGGRSLPHPDAMAGTLLSTSNGALVTIIFIICLIDLINQNKINKYILYLFILLSITAIPILGEANAFFYFLPIILFIRYFDFFINFNFKKISLVLSGLIIFVYLSNQTGLYNLDVNFSDFRLSKGKNSLQTEYDDTIAMSVSERFLSLVAISNFIKEKPERIMFGSGLGSYVFRYDTRQNFVISTDKDYIIKFSATRLIANIGVVGFLIFCFILLKISYYAYNASFRTQDKFFISVFRIIPAFSILFILSMFYSEPFEDVIAFSYWFFVSSLYYLPNISK
tara:strand:+ start:148 stop:1401 length:1254 start_codon:yes stop_codon:yes gene_type:complete